MMEKIKDRTMVTKSAVVKWITWTICGTFHTNMHQFQQTVSIDSPIGCGFARSLIPIMANSSHQRLGPTVLMSHL